MSKHAKATALILNANAKHVSARRAKALSLLCNAGDVYLSHNLEEAQEIARTVVEKGYGRVLSGGGDGTLVCVLNNIFAAMEAQGAPSPQVGILKLGTGNAVASMMGSARAEDDLLSLIHEPRLPTMPMGLVRSPEDGLDFPFAGIGYDGEVLNDYLWVKQHMRGPLVDELMHSVLGYFTALFARTLPRKLAEDGPANVRITSRGRAYFRDPANGDAMVEMAPGSVLYDGPAAMVSVGTVPFYGYNFRIFPFAQDVPGMMQLRVVGLSPWNIMANLPGIWRGDFRHQDVKDFHVEDIVVEGDRALPYQIGGDARGHRQRLEFCMSQHTVQMVSPRQDFQLAA